MGGIGVRAALLSAALLGGILTGCGKEEGRTPAVPLPGFPRQGMPERGKAVSEPAGQATLALAPGNPNARTGVSATLTGLPPDAFPRWEKVRWFVNGTDFPGEGKRLPGRMIRRGDRVKASAEVTVNGGTLNLTTLETTVGNSLPEVLSAGFSDNTPKTGQELRVDATGRDADGDPVTFGYRWYINDQEVVGETSNVLSLRKVPKGMSVHAEVQAHDGFDAGAKRLLPKVRVVNSAPVLEEVTFARGVGEGRITANIRVRDADNDPVSILAKALPEGITLSGTVLSWEESAIPPGKDAPVVLLLSDGDGGDVECSFQLSRDWK